MEDIQTKGIEFDIKSNKKDDEKCQKCKNQMKIQKYQPVILNCGDKICLSCVKSCQEPQEDTSIITCLKCNKTQQLNVKVEEKRIQTFQ